MLSDVMKKKLTTHFRLMDLDGDGYVELEDWEQGARNLAQIREWAPESDEYKALLAKHENIWNSFWKPADTDEDGKVTLTEYLALADHQRTQDFFTQDVVLSLFGAIFDTIDRDDDGKITTADYQRYFAAWGLEANRAKVAFSEMDINNDGLIARYMFIQLGLNFYLSDDPEDKGNWLFGSYE